MNIQIFGKNKCFASKSAERFFKERGIKFQYINLNQKALSAGELDRIVQSIGNVDALFDTQSTAYEQHNVAYILRSPSDKKELLLNYPSLLKTPIVRDCTSKKCTVGEASTTWKEWIAKIK